MAAAATTVPSMVFHLFTVQNGSLNILCGHSRAAYLIRQEYAPRMLAQQLCPDCMACLDQTAGTDGAGTTEI